MLASIISGKRKWSEMLAFSNDYYELIFRATQSVELFCAYCSFTVISIFWSDSHWKMHSRKQNSSLFKSRNSYRKNRNNFLSPGVRKHWHSSRPRSKILRHFRLIWSQVNMIRSTTTFLLLQTTFRKNVSTRSVMIAWSMQSLRIKDFWLCRKISESAMRSFFRRSRAFLLLNWAVYFLISWTMAWRAAVPADFRIRSFP